MSTDLKTVYLVSVGILIFSFGCAMMPPETSPPSKQVPETRPAISSSETTDSIKEQAPRTIASLTLTEQAQLLIESKRPDEAIRILEKSMNINPNNGHNYYFLAEAWMLKRNKTQAREFNRMAGIYLNEDADWMRKVRHQKERIENTLKE